jgi:hypothetical protein
MLASILRSRLDHANGFEMMSSSRVLKSSNKAKSLVCGQTDKFIATHACQQITVAYVLADNVGCVGEHGVTIGMAMSVVHSLEVIEIYMQKPDRRAATRAQGVADERFEGCAIGHAG